jgi:hypothetical protein
LAGVRDVAVVAAAADGRTGVAVGADDDGAATADGAVDVVVAGCDSPIIRPPNRLVSELNILCSIQNISYKHDNSTTKTKTIDKRQALIRCQYDEQLTNIDSIKRRTMMISKGGPCCR